MPVYSATGPVIALLPDREHALFNAETPANGTASQAATVPIGVKLLGWQILWGAVPVGPDVRIQGAMRNVAAEFIDLAVSTDPNGEIGVIANMGFKFVRAYKAGGDQALTVLVTAKEG